MKTTARDWIDPTRLYNPSVPAGRLMYIWGSIVYPFGLLVGAGLLLGVLYGSGIEGTAVDALLTVLYPAFIVAGLLIAIRRLKDLGKSGWYLLWGLVPFANLILGLWLLLAPGVVKAPVRAEPLGSEPPETPSKPTKVSIRPDGSCPKCRAKVHHEAQSCPWCGTEFNHA